MELALTIGSLVLALGLGVALFITLELRYESLTEARQAEERCEALAGSLAERDDTIEELRAWVKQLREERRDEGESYLERAAQYENRISELIRQNQNLAERVASLRQEGLPEGGDDFHVEDVDPPKPYSPDLRDFYDSIEFVEAQERVEEFIESRRAAGIDDEQILKELEEG